VLHQYTLRVVDPSETLLSGEVEQPYVFFLAAHIKAGRYPPSTGSLESYSWKLEHHKGWDELIMNVNVWRKG
jgi:hypothetical protein